MSFTCRFTTIVGTVAASAGQRQACGAGTHDLPPACDAVGRDVRDGPVPRIAQRDRHAFCFDDLHATRDGQRQRKYAAASPISASLAFSRWPLPSGRWQQAQAYTEGFRPCATISGIGGWSSGYQSGGANRSFTCARVYAAVPGAAPIANAGGGSTQAVVARSAIARRRSRAAALISRPVS